MNTIATPRGRPSSGLRLQKVYVGLDRENADWGKSQPGGLSSLLRRLLAWERYLVEGDAEDQELASAREIATRGMTEGLTDEEVLVLCRAVIRKAGEACDG